MFGIRPFRSGDAKRIITWCSDEKNFYKWSAGIMGEFPLTEEKFLDAVSGRIDNENYFPFVAFDETGAVGFFILRKPVDSPSVLRFGFVIVDPKIRGKGFGKKMILLGMKYAFEIYGAEEVSLGVFENNPSAMKCYESCGFEKNGDEDEYELCGEKWKCIEMSKCRG